MSWIETIPYEAATGRLRALYERVKGPDGYLDNILMVHSLRPHTLYGHMSLYKNVLHHTGNALPKWLLETLGVYASLLNRCPYCVDHHFAGLRRLLGDDDRAEAIRTALDTGELDPVFTPPERAVLDYTRRLTLAPADLHRDAVDTLRRHGLDDGEILEINQVVAYFAYANRTVLGLGVTTEGDVLGLSPNDGTDAENWQHA